MNIVKSIQSYLFAFFAGMFILTYLLNIPGIITEKPEIVNEYYRKNYLTNIPLDCFFVLCYLLVAEYLSHLLKLKSNASKIAMVALTTAVLTTGFCYFLNKSPMDKANFFSRWFHTVGYTSVVYDVLLLVFMYVVYLYMEKITNKHA